MIRSIAEALVVVVIGAGIGLGVNAGRGGQKFAISRNHFARKVIASPVERDDSVNNNKSTDVSDDRHDGVDPNKTQSDPDDTVVNLPVEPRPRLATEVVSETDTNTAGAEGVADSTDETESEEWKSLVASGYQPMAHDQVVADFQGAEYEAGLIVFVDARDDAHYAKGHLAGAYQLDHYLLDNYIDTLLPACQNALKVVVYCNGGECEDSMFAAGDLIERGVDPNKVYVYVGGVSAWKRDGLPFESGERASGIKVYLDE